MDSHLLKFLTGEHGIEAADLFTFALGYSCAGGDVVLIALGLVYSVVHTSTLTHSSLVTIQNHL